MGAWVDDTDAALVTDLYELTMAAAYLSEGMEADATFDLFVRALPPQRAFLVAAGLDDALEYLGALHFDEEAIGYLGSLGRFDARFLDWLRAFRFSGEVWAVPEGEVVFAGEPLLTVTAPLPAAQLVETFLLTVVSFQTMVASKAARLALACDGRPFVDFSARRDHGPDAALRVGRAAYLGGASGTSNVLAARTYGIPLSGTMAHSFVMAFERELDAFRSFARQFPEHTVLLIDTYDTEEGARAAEVVSRELAERGRQLAGVRLDSGDLARLSKRVRTILDEGGQHHVKIFVSGDLDEYRIAGLLARGAPIDAFGVGTQLGTSGDAPSLSAVYKLAQLDRGARIKLSAGKTTLPGRKQVWRSPGDHDVIALEHEKIPGARPLLERVMADGRRLRSVEALGVSRQRCLDAVAGLPPGLRVVRSRPSSPYPVTLSPALRRLASDIASRHHQQRPDGAPSSPCDFVPQ